jgi:DNA-binding CsgD family transcriptional regulator
MGMGFTGIVGSGSCFINQPEPFFLLAAGLAAAKSAFYTEILNQAFLGNIVGMPGQSANTQHCVCRIHGSHSMNHLTRNDYAVAMQVLEKIEAHSDSVRNFAHAVVRELTDFVASELTTLSVCDLITGLRHVVGLRSALYGDYYRRIGLEYAIAVPLFSNHKTLVSVVLNRRGLDFDERDRERLELLRPHLAFLYRHARHAGRAVLAPRDDIQQLRMSIPPAMTAPDLTQREAEVMHWLACAKTDAEIAALLSISPRTVQKHLEHIYVKLGVETRTAAVMRALAGSAHMRAASRAGLFG